MYDKKTRPSSGKAELPPLRPPRSEEEAEKRAAGLATELAIEQLRNKTASSQIITHFLKQGSIQAQLEREKLMREIELLEARKKAIETAEEQEKKYQEVIRAIASYSGKDDEWEIVEDDYA